MEVRFENLHFGYTRKREILHGINLTLPSNKFVAVLGQAAFFQHRRHRFKILLVASFHHTAVKAHFLAVEIHHT